MAGISKVEKQRRMQAERERATFEARRLETNKAARNRYALRKAKIAASKKRSAAGAKMHEQLRDVPGSSVARAPTAAQKRTHAAAKKIIKERKLPNLKITLGPDYGKSQVGWSAQEKWEFALSRPGIHEALASFGGDKNDILDVFKAEQIALKAQEMLDHADRVRGSAPHGVTLSKGPSEPFSGINRDAQEFWHMHDGTVKMVTSGEKAALMANLKAEQLAPQSHTICDPGVMHGILSAGGGDLSDSQVGYKAASDAKASDFKERWDAVGLARHTVVADPTEPAPIKPGDEVTLPIASAYNIATGLRKNLTARYVVTQIKEQDDPSDATKKITVAGLAWASADGTVHTSAVVLVALKKA